MDKLEKIQHKLLRYLASEFGQSKLRIDHTYDHLYARRKQSGLEVKRPPLTHGVQGSSPCDSKKLYRLFSSDFEREVLCESKASCPEFFRQEFDFTEQFLWRHLAKATAKKEGASRS